MYSKNFLFSISMLGLTLLGCNSSNNAKLIQSEEKIVASNFSDEKNKIAVANKWIELSYEMVDTTKYDEKDLITIQCKVKNKSDYQVNYLKESCNGLEHFVVFQPNSYKVFTLLYCNASWLMISKLEANDSILFKTQFLKESKSKDVEKIGLNFKIVDKYIPLNEIQENPALINNDRIADGNLKNVIWAK